MNLKSPFWVVVVADVAVVVETDGLFLEVKTNLVMFQLTDPNPGVVYPTLPHLVFLTLLFHSSDCCVECCWRSC